VSDEKSSADLGGRDPGSHGLRGDPTSSYFSPYPATTNITNITTIAGPAHFAF
jgi:hypothetical protein